MERRRCIFILFLAVTYVFTRLPLIVDPLPTWYHSQVQLNTVEIAISTVKTGLVYEYVSHQSFAGANLHGILSAIVVAAGLPLKYIRLVMFVSGALTVGFYLGIARELRTSAITATTGAFLLTITPMFVLFTGLTFPEAVTLCFATGSLYAYARYTATLSLSWAVTSAALTGLAAFNHFWGGISFVTILALEAVTLFGRVTQYGRWRRWVRERASVWMAQIVALVPAGGLYVYFKLQGLGSHYGGYLLTDSWPVLFGFEYYRRLGIWTAKYATIVIPATIALMVAVAVIVRYGEGYAERNGQVVPSRLTFWSVWFLSALLVPLLLPGGAYAHTYYFWWALVPGAGLVAQTLDLHRRIGGTASSALRGLAIILVLLAAAQAGFYTAKYATDSRSLPDREPTAPGQRQHAQVLGSELRPVIEAGDQVVFHGNMSVETAQVYARYVRADRTSRPSKLTERTVDRADVIVTSERLKSSLEDNWKHISTVTAAGESSYIYRRTQRDEEASQANVEGDDASHATGVRFQFGNRVAVASHYVAFSPALKG